MFPSNPAKFRYSPVYASGVSSVSSTICTDSSSPFVVSGTVVVVVEVVVVSGTVVVVVEVVVVSGTVVVVVEVVVVSGTVVAVSYTHLTLPTTVIV